MILTFPQQKSNERSSGHQILFRFQRILLAQIVPLEAEAKYFERETKLYLIYYKGIKRNLNDTLSTNICCSVRPHRSHS